MHRNLVRRLPPPHHGLILHRRRPQAHPTLLPLPCHPAARLRTHTRPPPPPPSSRMPDVFHKLFLEWVELPALNATEGNHTALDFGDWLLAKGSNMTSTISDIVQPLLLAHLTAFLWEHHLVPLLEQQRQASPWRRYSHFLFPSPSRWWRRRRGGLDEEEGEEWDM